MPRTEARAHANKLCLVVFRRQRVLKPEEGVMLDSTLPQVFTCLCIVYEYKQAYKHFKQQ